MTINSTNRKAGPFLGDGVAKEFPFPFKVFSPADVLVVRTDPNGTESVLTLDSNYTMRKLTDQNVAPGGTVTLKVPLAAGHTLTLGSRVANLQPVDITNLGGNYPSVINGALDRATVQIQQLAEQVDRAMKAAFSSQAGVSLSMPAPVANRLLGWNTEGTALVNQDPGALVTDNSAAVDSRVTELVGDLEELAGEVDSRLSTLAIAQAGHGSRLSTAEDELVEHEGRIVELEAVHEGTFTPTLAGFGKSGTVSTSGRWVRSGKAVHWSITIDATAGGLSSLWGTSFVDGLPFTPAVSSACPVAFASGAQSACAMLTTAGRVQMPYFTAGAHVVTVSGVAIIA